MCVGVGVGVGACVGACVCVYVCVVCVLTFLCFTEPEWEVSHPLPAGSVGLSVS